MIDELVEGLIVAWCVDLLLRCKLGHDTRIELIAVEVLAEWKTRELLTAHRARWAQA